MTTLIIGSGLVGSQVARILVEQGERPILMDNAAQPASIGEIVDSQRTTLIEGDILRPYTLSKAIVDHKITGIVHTAAHPMLTLGAQRDPYAAIQLNIMGTVNVLEAARVHGVKRVVVSSSSVLNHYLVAGDGSHDPMKEEGFPRPSTFYAATKQAVESIGLNYARYCGIEFAGLRYGAVFGPWSGHGGGGPSNVMREAVRAAIAGEEAILPSGGMEWVYSKDAATGTVQALQTKTIETGIFNVTMGTLATPEDMANALRTVVPGAKVRNQTPQASSVSMMNMSRASDLSRAKRVIGFTPHYDMVTGLRDLVEWMKLRAKNVR
ncbi:MAG: NAD(P)-dependent oxidoreductase [Alphaproteobacteria bacterium]|nr:NAD(P)-dependent oxidoreductase [Alphaproteobacteria bacterium]